jgi:hypothetical protein
MRLIAHTLDQTLLERTVAVAEQTGGFGARQLRAVLDSTPLFGAGRVEDTWNLLGHALRTAVGLAAQELGTSAVAVVEDAGVTLVGPSRLKAALALDGGRHPARPGSTGRRRDRASIRTCLSKKTMDLPSFERLNRAAAEAGSQCGRKPRCCVCVFGRYSLLLKFDQTNALLRSIR